MQSSILTLCKSRYNLYCTSFTITNIHNDAFISRSYNQCENNIEQLRLNSNSISELNKLIFRALIHLTTIKLQNNKIKLIDKLLFRYNEQLTYIDLRYNLINQFHIDLDILPNIDTLRLEKNKLTTLDHISFKYFIIHDGIPKKRILMINNNEFRCKCTMHWMKEISNARKKRITFSDEDICPDYSITLNCSFDLRRHWRYKCPLFNKSICGKGYNLYLIYRL